MKLQKIYFVLAGLCIYANLSAQIQKGDFSGNWNSQLLWQNDQLLFNQQSSFDYMLSNRLSIGTSLQHQYFQEEGLRTQTTEVAPRLRYFLTNPDSKFQFYLEGGAGLLSSHFTAKERPFRPTERHLTGNLGIGSFFFIRPNVVLNSSLNYRFTEQLFQNSSLEFSLNLLPYFGKSSKKLSDGLGGLKKGSKIMSGDLTLSATEFITDLQANFEYSQFVSNRWTIGGEVNLFAPGISNFAAQTNLTTRYYFAPKHKQIDPYLFVKSGLLTNLENNSLFQWKAGGGVNIRLTDLIILDLQAGYTQRPGHNNGNLEINLGTKILLGK